MLSDLKLWVRLKCEFYPQKHSKKLINAHREKERGIGIPGVNYFGLTTLHIVVLVIDI